ncbi:MAG: cysteine--tRNA ligase [archaeon]
MKLFNTFTRKKDEFKEIKTGHVGMYTCGPTVYDYAHIGNFRAYICADVLRRYLLYKGYKVTQVMNLTDVDDKTIRGANEQGVKLDDYTKKFKDAFFEDLKALNILPADFYPEATKHIKEMVAQVQALIGKGMTYEADGSVYYKISEFKDYGRLSKIKLGEQKAGARVDQDEYEKESAHDFVLWKGAKEGEPSWDTAIGKGRPGWHIECSAMSSKYLGKHFDIHTGGIDLIFPHHENEIAQAEGANDEPFVNYWVHNEYLMVEGKKMSKSLGNFYTLRDLLGKGYSPKAIRYLLLSAHYKVPLNFTIKGLESAERTVEKFRDFLMSLDQCKGAGNPKAEKLIADAKAGFEKHMDDDLNISSALAFIFDFMRDVNKEEMSVKDADKVRKVMMEFDSVLGILEFEADVPSGVLDLVARREEARKKKDWASADSLRDEIREKGFSVDDTAEGPVVKKAAV